jgi:hypothetical protein
MTKIVTYCLSLRHRVNKTPSQKRDKLHTLPNELVPLGKLPLSTLPHFNTIEHCWFTKKLLTRAWPVNCYSLVMLETYRAGSMKVSSTEKVKVLAEQNGWTLAWANGYVAGEISRKRGRVPPKHLLIGIDEYCLGFRAGFFANVRKSPGGAQANKEN